MVDSSENDEIQRLPYFVIHSDNSVIYCLYTQQISVLFLLEIY